jgi:hypothetical protein
MLMLALLIVPLTLVPSKIQTMSSLTSCVTKLPTAAAPMQTS